TLRAPSNPSMAAFFPTDNLLYNYSPGSAEVQKTFCLPSTASDFHIPRPEHPDFPHIRLLPFHLYVTDQSCNCHFLRGIGKYPEISARQSYFSMKCGHYDLIPGITENSPVISDHCLIPAGKRHDSIAESQIFRNFQRPDNIFFQMPPFCHKK